MKKNRIILLVVAFFYLLPLHSQKIYDLNNCITIGMERNFSILIARNNEAISSNNHSIGNAGMLPTLDLNGRYGGDVTNSKQGFQDNEISLNGVNNTSEEASVALGWTIFEGFNAMTTYKKLGELKQIGELNTKMTVENLVADITTEYYLYIQQGKLYDNLAYAVALSRERVRIDQERYMLGAASKLQLLQSIVYLNTDSSRFAKQEEVLKTSQVRLNKLMALQNLDESIVPRDSMIPINPDLQYQQLFDETLKLNTSLQIASSNRTISEYDYKIIASRTYPYLNLSTGYGYSKNHFGEGEMISQERTGMNYGLTLGFGLFDGFNRNREKKNAKIDIENWEHQYNEIEQQVKADLITIYFAYVNNLRLLELEEQNLKTAEENLQIALERYKLGSLSGLELREVQKSLLDAEERLITVEFQTKLAEISLFQISGRIMEYLNTGAA